MKKVDAVFVPSALAMVEQALFLLRRQGIRVLADYYTGSLPFVLGLLYFWFDMSRSPFAQGYCSPAAAGLAFLFIWMKYWHVRFCRQLWHAQYGTHPDPQPFFAEVATAARQALLQATGWVVQPVAAVILLPLAWTYAFYQNVTVMDLPHSSDLKTLYRNAMAQSLLWPGQNHLLLCIIPFFSVVVLLNIMLSMLMLPYFLKKVVGIETVFTISGIHALTNTTFFATACALTYLCVDPMVKAVYTLRCFYSKSRFTGDDIRIRLKSGIKAALILPMMLTALSGATARAGENTMVVNTPNETLQISVRAGQLDRSIREVLQNPRFAWRMPREGNTADTAQAENRWLTATVKWLAEKVENMLAAVGRWIESIREWFQKAMPEKTDKVGHSPMLNLLIRAVFLVLLVSLAAFGMARLRQFFRGRTIKPQGKKARTLEKIKIDLNDESLAASDLPHDRWLTLAEDFFEKKDFRQALRALYLAVLACLGDRQKIVIARHKSNHEYLWELAAHAHAEPELFALFEKAMTVFERIWYGMHPVAPASYNRFRKTQERIRTLAQQHG